METLTKNYINPIDVLLQPRLLCWIVGEGSPKCNELVPIFSNAISAVQTVPMFCLVPLTSHCNDSWSWAMWVKSILLLQFSKLAKYARTQTSNAQTDFVEISHALRKEKHWW